MAVKAAPSGEAPAGRWVPWLVIGLWVVLAVVIVPLRGRLSSVTADGAGEWRHGAARDRRQSARRRSDQGLTRPGPLTGRSPLVRLATVTAPSTEETA
jgi:hypothetical protein